MEWIPQDEVWTFFLFMNLKVFEKNEWKVRTFMDEKNEAWFSLSDVCASLDIKNPSNVKKRLKEKGCIMIDLNALHSKEGLEINQLWNSNATFINTSNVFRCIFESRKEEAEMFKDWVFEDVLPSLYEKGGYMIEKENETPEELMARALSIANDVLKRKEERIKEIEKENAEIVEKNRILDCDNKLLKYNVDIQKDIVEESIATQERFYDFFNTDETYTATQIGNLIGKSAIWVNRLLRDNKLMKKVGNQYVPIPELIRKGYARQVATRSYKGGVPNTFFTYRWTAKGVAFIKQLYIKHECNNPHSLMGNTPPGKLDIELTLDEMDSFISPVNRGNNRRR